MSLRSLFAEPPAVARALLEPTRTIAWSTGRARLVAVQRFVRECGRDIGIPSPLEFLEALDALLPARTPRDWHTVGTIIAGSRTRGRPQCPTLYPQDLERVVSDTGTSVSYRHLRDKVLVALHCSTGLRPDEIARLRRSDVLLGTDGWQVVVEVWRAGRLLRLPLTGPSTGLLLALCQDHRKTDTSVNAHLFRRTQSSNQPLSLRAVRGIVRRVCARAGFPLANATDLRAGFAYSLRLRGLSDHETAAMLGLKQVRSLDRLLARHAALDAQRRVREALDT